MWRTRNSKDPIAWAIAIPILLVSTWILILQPMRYRSEGTRYNPLTTFHMGGMARDEMMRQIPRVFLQFRKLDVVLEPDGFRRSGPRRPQTYGPGWAIALDGFRVVARCRYETVWDEDPLRFWPNQMKISDCETEFNR